MKISISLEINCERHSRKNQIKRNEQKFAEVRWETCSEEELEEVRKRANQVRSSSSDKTS